MFFDANDLIKTTIIILYFNCCKNYIVNCIFQYNTFYRVRLYISLKRASFNSTRS